MWLQLFYVIVLPKMSSVLQPSSTEPKHVTTQFYDKRCERHLCDLWRSLPGADRGTGGREVFSLGLQLTAGWGGFG